MFVQGIYSVNLNHLARLVSEKTEKKHIQNLIGQELLNNQPEQFEKGKQIEKENLL